MHQGFLETRIGELGGEARDEHVAHFLDIGTKISDKVPNEGRAEKRHLFTERAEDECMDGYVELLKELDMEIYIP